VLSPSGNVYYCSITFNPPEAQPEDPQADPPQSRTVLYARYPDGSYEPYDGTVLPIANLKNDLIPVEPELYCEQPDL